MRVHLIGDGQQLRVVVVKWRHAFTKVGEIAPKLRAAAAAVTLGCAMIAALAATSPAQDAKVARTWRLTIDNDLIALRGAGPPPDYDYPHGTLLSFSTAAAPAYMRRVMRKTACGSGAAREGGCLATTLAIGHEIYTPRRDSTSHVPGERPYAGKLYAAAIVHEVSDGRSRSARIDVGVTGRLSLAGAVQDEIYQALGNQPQLGWAAQFPSRAAVSVTLSEARSHDVALGSQGRLTLTGYGGASVGNLRAELHAGAVFEVETARGAPLHPDIVTRPHACGWYGLVGTRQYVVAADALITGIGLGQGASLRPFVGELQAGFGFRGRRLALEYRDVIRTREYDAQPRLHAFGSLTALLFQ